MEAEEKKYMMKPCFFCSKGKELAQAGQKDVQVRHGLAELHLHHGFSGGRVGKV